jgi:hypothetical protein
VFGLGPDAGHPDIQALAHEAGRTSDAMLAMLASIERWHG